MPELWPFVVYAAIAVFMVVVMLVLSYFLGQQHREPQTGTPYEGGIVPEGTIQARVTFEFYLVAAFFVVFDVETVFLFAWAVAGRSLAWAAFVELAIFVGVLLCALIYLWREGALEGSRTLRRRAGSRSSRGAEPQRMAHG